MAWLLALLLPAIPVSADTTPAHHEEDNEVVERRICTRDKDERLLQVIPHEKGCVLHYTKSNATEEKAKSVRGVQVCKDALKKIATRLEGAGFRCQE